MVKITLCGKEIPLYPKSVPYLQKKVLVPAWDFIQGGGDGGGFGIDAANAPAKAYEVLVLLAPNIPKYVPLHAFLGYPSADAMEADDGQDFDTAFTLPEFYAAMDAAMEVSGVKRLLEGRKLVDPQWARAVLTEVLQDGVDTMRAHLSTTSESSPSTKDGSAPSTTGTTTAPTPTASTESPSLALSH